MGKKSGSTKTVTNTYDPVASAKMAEIAGRQQGIAEEQWNMYKNYFQDYEIAAAKANKELLPYITEASRLTLQEQARDLEANRPIKEKFREEALKGVDVKERADQAGANVVSALASERGTLGRTMSRYGISPGSSRFKSGLSDTGVKAAEMVAGARNRATEQAEQENFGRLGAATGVGFAGGQNQTYFGTADPAQRSMQAYSGAASSMSPLASRVLSSQQKDSGGDFWDFAGNVLGQAAGTYAGKRMG